MVIVKKFIKPVWKSFHAITGQHNFPSFEPKLWILMYHRVLPISDVRYANEEPGMVVQPATFEMHLKLLKKYFTLVKLKDWVAAKLEGRPLPKKACAVTFDDGWLDNYEYALPILKSHQVPATLFAVSEKIGTDFNFWPNSVADLLLYGGHDWLSRVYPFSEVFYKLHPNRNFQVPTRDGVAVWIKLLKHYSDSTIYTALQDIPKAAFRHVTKSALMDWRQLQEMHASGWVDIGSHTCNHLRLNRLLDSTALHHEIVASRTQIEAKLQAPVPLFCYPNGDFSPQAQALVEKNYLAAVTTNFGISSANHNLCQLPRLGMHEDACHTSIAFRARLSGRR